MDLCQEAKINDKAKRIGYARVSKLEQDPDHQIRVLKSSGCADIFVDHVTGARRARPALDGALAALEAGDTLVVWRFDRLGRSLQHLLNILGSLGERKIQLQSLTEQIDTRTPMGKLFFAIIVALAEFERSLISERTLLAAAQRKEKDIAWGRPSIFHDREVVETAMTLLRDPDMNRAGIARHLGISTNTLYRWFPLGKAENFGIGKNKPRFRKGGKK